jgi:hypothetical protein
MLFMQLLHLNLPTADLFRQMIYFLSSHVWDILRGLKGMQYPTPRELISHAWERFGSKFAGYRDSRDNRYELRNYPIGRKSQWTENIASK